MENIRNCFDFQTVMDAIAQANQFVLDDNQRHIISRLDALMMPLFNPGQVKKTFDGVYIWGKVGRGKSFIVDTFFSAVPVKNKMRVHFHHFFRELHHRIANQENTDNSVAAALMAQLGDCRLLCFDELHLHDIGDAMLMKRMLDVIFQHGIILIATSNYPPDELLSNPLYHQRFVPSIKLIEQHMDVVALAGNMDYRTLGANDTTPFCEGAYLCPGTREQRSEYGLPLPACTALPLAVGYRIIDLLSPALDYLHLSFEALCVAPTAVMDYLMLCEQHRSWIIEGVPALTGVSLATQQRFINVIDVLYDQNCRLFLISEHTLEEMTEGVEQEDIQRTRSRLNQLKHYVLSHSSHHDNGLGRN